MNGSSDSAPNGRVNRIATAWCSKVVPPFRCPICGHDVGGKAPVPPEQVPLLVQRKTEVGVQEVMLHAGCQAQCTPEERAEIGDARPPDLALEVAKAAIVIEPWALGAAERIHREHVAIMAEYGVGSKGGAHAEKTVRSMARLIQCFHDQALPKNRN